MLSEVLAALMIGLGGVFLFEFALLPLSRVAARFLVKLTDRGVRLDFTKDIYLNRDNGQAHTMH